MKDYTNKMMKELDDKVRNAIKEYNTFRKGIIKTAVYKIVVDSANFAKGGILPVSFHCKGVSCAIHFVANEAEDIADYVLNKLPNKEILDVATSEHPFIEVTKYLDEQDISSIKEK